MPLRRGASDAHGHLEDLVHGAPQSGGLGRVHASLQHFVAPAVTVPSHRDLLGGRAPAAAIAVPSLLEPSPPFPGGDESLGSEVEGRAKRREDRPGMHGCPGGGASGPRLGPLQSTHNRGHQQASGGQHARSREATQYTVAPTAPELTGKARPCAIPIPPRHYTPP